MVPWTLIPECGWRMCGADLAISSDCKTDSPVDMELVEVKAMVEVVNEGGEAIRFF